MTGRYRIRFWLILVVAAVTAALYGIGWRRLTIETDILRSLPRGDPVLADARSVLLHHPMQERIAIDLGHDRADPSALVDAAETLEARLRASGLFKNVGLGREQSAFAELATRVTSDLPSLFDPGDLERDIAPLLQPGRIRASLAETQASLAGLDGIGQARLIASDPLGFRNVALRRLAPLAPAGDASMHQGRPLSGDRRHLLLLAEPNASAHDTAFALKATALFADAARDLGPSVTLTPVGGYRAALDNETAVKADTQQAIVVSTVAIIALLLLGFRRPWIGLLALAPALGGTMVAFFVYSLLRPSISLLAIGFGGAVISFTVDYGIAYLLFLDRPEQTRGIDATRQVWSLGLLAMLTTAVSFALLFMAGFPALTELGLFAALGVVGTYLFVHAVYPFLFVSVPGARRNAVLPLQRLADWVASGGARAAVVVGLIGVVMLVRARPVFDVDLASMNSVSAQTQRAEKLVRSVWGDVMTRALVVVRAPSARELSRKGDLVAERIDAMRREGILSASFVPSMLFPGEERAKRNHDAWRAFFTRERVASLRRDLGAAAEDLGFAPGAFGELYRMLEADAPPRSPIPESAYPVLGIAADPDELAQYSTVAPGPAYDGERLYREIAGRGLAAVFDPSLFSARLGKTMLDGFVRVSLVVGLVTFLVALLYLAHLRLTLVALAPTAFSLVCTIATLRLLGQPLGIPVITVGAVVIGMGTDYALYLVRAHQRYQDEKHPAVGLVRLSVLLSFATTFVGFGALVLSRHVLLRSSGAALTLGIGFSYLGTVTLVPPLVRRVLAPAPDLPVRGDPLRRYAGLEAYPRLFARFKLRLDPMFQKLAGFVGDARVLLDVGTGYGVPAAFLLELLPAARLFGIEPDEGRVRVASHALGPRGVVVMGRAPDVPAAPEKADVALVLDIAHYLDDAEIAQTLSRLRDALRPGGRLVLRATVPAAGRVPMARRIEMIRLWRAPSHYRSAAELETAVRSAGFDMVTVEPSAPGREETWFVASSSPARP